MTVKAAKKIQKIVFFTALISAIIAVVVVLRVLGSRIYTRSIPVGSISISTDYSKYLVGENVSFTIKNNFNSSVYINNNCPNEPLEVFKRQDDGSWKQIHDKIEASECQDSDRQIIVKPNDAASGTFKRWKNLFNEPGVYRIVVYVEYYNELPYQDIEIIEKPAVPEIPTIASGGSDSQSSNDNGGSSSTGSSETPASQTPTTSPGTQPTQPEESPPAKKRKTVTVGNAGTIVVDYDATTVYVVSVTPNSGYSYEGSDPGSSGRQIEITFKGGGGELQVQLSVRNGELVSKTEN